MSTNTISRHEVKPSSNADAMYAAELNAYYTGQDASDEVASVEPTPARKSTSARSMRFVRVCPTFGYLYIADSKGTKSYALTDGELQRHGLGERFRHYHCDKTIPEGNDADRYDVLIDKQGNEHSCECLGHLRYGHRKPCRHIAAILRLRELNLVK